METIIKQFITDENGQGITEYGAVLAFTALLVGSFFQVSTGPFSEILDGTYHRISAALVALVDRVSA